MNKGVCALEHVVQSAVQLCQVNVTVRDKRRLMESFFPLAQQSLISTAQGRKKGRGNGGGMIDRNSCHLYP